MAQAVHESAGDTSTLELVSIVAPKMLANQGRENVGLLQRPARYFGTLSERCNSWLRFDIGGDTESQVLGSVGSAQVAPVQNFLLPRSNPEFRLPLLMYFAASLVFSVWYSIVKTILSWVLRFSTKLSSK